MSDYIKTTSSAFTLFYCNLLQTPPDEKEVDISDVVKTEGKSLVFHTGHHHITRTGAAGVAPTERVLPFAFPSRSAPPLSNCTRDLICPKPEDSVAAKALKDNILKEGYWQEAAKDAINATKEKHSYKKAKRAIKKKIHKGFRPQNESLAYGDLFQYTRAVYGANHTAEICTSIAGNTGFQPVCRPIANGDVPPPGMLTYGQYYDYLKLRPINSTHIQIQTCTSRIGYPKILPICRPIGGTSRIGSPDILPTCIPIAASSADTTTQPTREQIIETTGGKNETTGETTNGSVLKAVKVIGSVLGAASGTVLCAAAANAAASKIRSHRSGD